jgi:hypothetical protein
MSPGALVGAWRLVSFHDLDDEGNRHEGPLGNQPRGLLCYSADGHVSVTMMRTGPAAEPSYMSYAGTWRRVGTQVVHTITIAPDASWLGIDQVRDMEPDGDRLTLYGTALAGPPRRRVLEWRRFRGEVDDDVALEADRAGVLPR